MTGCCLANPCEIDGCIRALRSIARLYCVLSHWYGALAGTFVVPILRFAGTIVEACSTEVKSFAGGAILYQVRYYLLLHCCQLTRSQIGYTAVQLLVEVLIGDTTTLRNRVLFSFIPAWPFLVRIYSVESTPLLVISRVFPDKRMDQRKRHVFRPRRHHLAMGYRDVGYHLLR